MRRRPVRAWRSVGMGMCRPRSLSREINDSGVRRYPRDGRPHRSRRYARVVAGPRAVREPGHAQSLHAREPGDPAVICPPTCGLWVRAARGRLWPYARDGWWEVGQPRSTCEAAEQGWVTGGGGGGGKGAGQGESRAGKTRSGCSAGLVRHVRWFVHVGPGGHCPWAGWLT